MEPMSLFEAEMRSQIEAAQSSLAAAELTADPILIEAAHNRFDDLLALARRNGLTVTIDLDVAAAPAPAA